MAHNEFVIHNVADDRPIMNLLCTMLHMIGPQWIIYLLYTMLQMKRPQRICYAQCCIWQDHKEFIMHNVADRSEAQNEILMLRLENEPNEHVLPIILFNYLVLKMVPSFEMNILGDYLSYLYSLLLWYPLSAFNLPGYGWKPIGILGIISTSNSKLLCPMCFCKRNKVCLPLIMKATQQFLLFITTLAKRVPTFLSWYMYMYELLSCNH